MAGLTWAVPQPAEPCATATGQTSGGWDAVQLTPRARNKGSQHVYPHTEAEPRCAASQLCKARTCPSHLAAISPSISARLMQVYMTPHACKLNIGSFYQQVCTTCKHELCKTINCLIIRGSSCAGCGEDTHSCRRGSPWTFSAWTAAVGLVMVFSLTSCPKQLMQHPMSPQHLRQEGEKKAFY